MAASEKKIRQVLKILTSTELQTLAKEQWSPMQDLRAILSSPNVVGVGITKKRTKEKATGPLALTFYVREKVSKNDLTAADFVPPALPEALSGPRVIPTDVVELGDIHPQANVTRNPVQPGNSIGLPASAPGTLGAVVRDSTGLLVLSNSHVLARSGLSSVGDPILYPGANPDGGNLPNDELGKLVRFEPFQTGGQLINRVDGAVSSLSEASLAKLSVEIRTLNSKPAGIIKARRDMVVEKVGRTSDLTEGIVVDIDFHCVLDYPGIGSVGFADQVLCTRYTEDGDSGSLVLEKETHKAVGLHVGAAKGGSMFTPIREVLSVLGVQLEM
jgi:hypothetical protein